jgi:hypothetical protein
VRAEDGHGIQGYLLKVFHEEGTTITQIPNYMAVVDNFMQHVDRGAIQLERTFNGLYGANHPCTKSTRSGENNFHG